MNLNNCHNCVMGGRTKSHFSYPALLIILLIIISLLVSLTSGCQLQRPQDSDLTAPASSRHEAAPLVLSKEEVLTQEGANI